MESKFFKTVSVIILCCLILGLNTFASFADVITGEAGVGKYSEMYQAETGISRTGKYSYVTMLVRSVFPMDTYITDNFTKCKSQLYHHTVGNCPISDVYILTEGHTTDMEIKNGYLDVRKFDLCFAGNHPDYAAWISYAYDAH